MTNAYFDWNSRLLDYCCEHSVDDARRVYLTVGTFLEALPGEDREEEFLRVVRNEFRLPFGNDYRRRLVAFSGQDARGRPLWAALLGVTVLAAGEMDSNAYYEHLSKRLECNERAVQQAFQNTLFIRAWDDLRSYFRKQELVLPEPIGGKIYVRMPQQHALLRQIDIRRLAEFFCEYQLSPRYYFTDADIEYRFSNWMRLGRLTSWGTTAWNDIGRRASVLLQVRNALESWNEDAYRRWRRDEQGRRSVSGIQKSNSLLDHSIADKHRFDRVRRYPVHLVAERDDGRDGADGSASLHFVLSRPDDDLPTSVPFAGSTFKRNGNSYSPIGLKSEEQARILKLGGCESLAGIQVLFQIDQPESYRGAFIFLNQNGDGYEQASALQVGIQSAMLVERPYATTIRAWLTREVPRSTARVLASHRFCADFTPRSVAPAPSSFPNLHISTELTTRLSGGLRLDASQNTWMDSAPPTVHFVGNPRPAKVIINGAQELEILSDGSLSSDVFNDVGGEFHIEAVAQTSHPVQVNFRLVEPEIRCSVGNEAFHRLFGDIGISFVEPPITTTPIVTLCAAEAIPTAPDPTPTVPSKLDSHGSNDTNSQLCYRWTLIGPSPGDAIICPHAMTSTQAASIAQEYFEPAWAVG